MALVDDLIAALPSVIVDGVTTGHVPDSMDYKEIFALLRAEIIELENSMGLGEFNIARFSANTSASAATNRAAIQACATASAAAGGVVTAPFTPVGDFFAIDDMIDLTGTCLWGNGSDRTVFECTTLDAGLTFTTNLGMTDNAERAGLSGNFGVAAGPGYMAGVANRPLVIGERVQATFMNVQCGGGKLADADDGVGLLLWGTQNCSFINFEGFNHRVVLRFDGGAANNHFLKCEIAGGTYCQVEYRNDVTTSGQTDYTYYNVLESTILEWTEPTTVYMLRSTCGFMNTLRSCPIYVNGHFGGGIYLPTAMDYAVWLDDSEVGSADTPSLRLEDIDSTGFDAPLQGFLGVEIGTFCEAWLEGGSFQRYPLIARGPVQIGREPKAFGSIAQRWDFTNGVNASPHTLRTVPPVHRAAGAGELIELLAILGESNYRRYSDALGRFYYGGGSGAADVDIGRYGAGIIGVTGALRTTDKVFASAGLGVGNSAAATTPGAVVRKMEVFSSSTGLSIGFVPIYSTIT